MARSQNRVQLSLRLPEDIVQVVDKYAAENRMSKTDAVVHFLCCGISGEGISDDRLAAIERKLADIECMLKSSGEQPRPSLRQSEAFDAVARAAEGFPAIERAYVFGSFARDQQTAESDVDVRIEVDRSLSFNLHDLAHFMKAIEQSTGRKVDVVSARVVKNPALAAAIEKDKVLVYERETE
ncbi:MAG: nucleotidyltransferase domain-containing protein [Slackia sp.]|nr:nucleotidyltransferase domain-containing protein [Slackia sp.]